MNYNAIIRSKGRPCCETSTKKYYKLIVMLRKKQYMKIVQLI